MCLWIVVNSCDIMAVAQRKDLLEGKKMNKNTWILLIVGIILIGLFMISWLVFKNLKVSDWIALGLGILDLVILVISLKKK